METVTPIPQVADPGTPGQSVQAALIRSQTDLQLQAHELRAEAERRQPGPDPMVMHDMLAKAQAEFQPVVRNRTVRVWSQRLQKEYTFKYAELHSVLNACLPALNKHGFYFRQFLDPADSMIMVSELLHPHGRLEGRVKIFLMGNDGQAYNSALTYARRAGAVLLFGVAAEDDDDGNLGNGNEAHVAYSPPAGKDAYKVPGRAGKPGKAPQQPVHPEAARQAAKAAPAAPAKPAEATAPSQATLEDYLRVSAIDGNDPFPAPTDELALEKAEGRIVDATAELQEAASEGRAHGIEQIWNEVKGESYVAMRIWRRLQSETPDLFAVIKATLVKAQPAATGKRGDRG